jgi:hypothetical protein
MPHVFLDDASKPLLVLHALSAFALLGACTHQLIVGIGLLRGRLHLFRLARVYATVVGPLFALAFVVGLLMYPHYRYHVRGLYLDRYAVWASNLFDLKENLAALAMPLVLGLFVVGRRLNAEAERSLLMLHVSAAFALWAVVTFDVVAGLLVTSVKGV